VITSSDKEYKATKRIKLGETQLGEPFEELARWISVKWNVTVLNVIHDPADDLRPARIQVILEHGRDAQTFRDGMNFDSRKQKTIAKKFLEIIDRDGLNHFDVNRLFVVFSAFAPIAREEANGLVTDSEVDELKRRIGNPNLWEISRCFASVTFFFFTDDQARAAEQNGLKEQYGRLYFELLKPRDQFNYLDETAFTVAVDSKQNFDENYQSNWYYYYK